MSNTHRHRPNGCCDYHRHVTDGCCHCEEDGERKRRVMSAIAAAKRRRAPTLTDFLLARIAEDEAKWVNTMDHRGEWDGIPARMAAECKAKRLVVERFTPVRHGYSELLAILALPYADHPDYREEWALDWVVY